MSQPPERHPSGWVEMRPGWDAIYLTCQDETCPDKRGGQHHAHFARYEEAK